MVKILFKEKKGFTLIELLVVIAIIGLLSSLAAVAAARYRDYAKDSKVVTNLSQIRIIASMINNEDDSYAELCDIGNLKKSHPRYGEALTTLEDDIKKMNNGTSPVCFATDTAYCVQSSLVRTGYLCLDSTGYLGKEANCDEGHERCEE